jgi:mRNA-degrading endonuclease toxin of MazEF toxin-antitoxin module
MPPKQGEIYYAKAGNDESRPVLVISRNELNHGIYLSIIPFTTKHLEERRLLPNCISFEAEEFGLTKDCVAQADLLAAIPKRDVDLAAGAIGTLDQDRLDEVLEAIKYVFALV